MQKKFFRAYVNLLRTQRQLYDEMEVGRSRPVLESTHRKYDRQLFLVYWLQEDLLKITTREGVYKIILNAMRYVDEKYYEKD